LENRQRMELSMVFGTVYELESANLRMMKTISTLD